jgi:hypothetical protein
VTKLPTVHMYRKGSGKIVDMTCKPSLFHLVVDELHRVMDERDETARVRGTDLVLEENSNGNVFDVAMEDGSVLGEEIVASLKKKDEKEEVDGKKQQNKNWFRFSF